MGICWYCYWGWPKAIADIYKAALDKLDGWESPLHFGPAHIVWEDENFDSAEWCLEHFEEYTGNDDYTAEHYAIVRWSLEELAKLPMSERDVEPANYDEKHPELFPPPAGLTMIADPRT